MMRHFGATLSLVVAFGLLLAPLAIHAAKIDKAAIAKVWADVEGNLKNGKATVDSQIEAVRKLDGILDAETALKLLAYFDSCDNSYKPPEKGKTASGRDKESYKVATAILHSVASMTDGDEALLLKDHLLARDKWPLRTRMAMLDAIVGCASTHAGCHALLMDWARSCKDVDVRVLITLSFRALTSDAKIADLVYELLNDHTWRVRDAAVEALVDFSSVDRDRAVLALINRLYHEEGKLRQTIADALRKITGEDHGSSSDSWCDWWKSAGKAEGGLPPHKSDAKSTGTRIFGSETFSNRFVFVIDSSISMLEKITPEEKQQLKQSFTDGPGEGPNTPVRAPDGRKPLDWDKINCKLDLAREELIRSLEVMDPAKTSFTIISFSDNANFWKTELVACNKENREAAEKWLRALVGKSKTNIFDALEKAFDFSEAIAGIDPKKGGGGGKVITGPNPEDIIPDTIFLYTDGFATSGKYYGDTTEQKKLGDQKYLKVYSDRMDAMIGEISDRNRVARMQINTIGVGKQDKRNLRKLAFDNRGTYIAIGIPPK